MNRTLSSRHHRTATGHIRLAWRIHTQFEEAALEAMLEELPGINAVAFPEHDAIEVRYQPGVVGEQQIFRAVRRAGFIPVEFSIEHRHRMRHSSSHRR